MKSQFVIFTFISICLFAISIAGCSREENDPDLPPMEQLTGTYTLVELQTNIGARTLSVKPPDVFGEFVLENKGKYFSLTIVIADETGLVGDNGQILWASWKINGNLWKANETTLTIVEHGATEASNFEYTWEDEEDGKYLTSKDTEGDVELIMKWQKL